MKRGHREQAVAAGLWALFLISGFYVFEMLFPALAGKLTMQAQKGICIAAEKLVTGLAAEMTPVIPYVLSGRQGRMGETAFPDLSYDDYIGIDGAESRTEPVEYVREETAAQAAVNEADGQGEETAEAVPAAAVSKPADRLARFQQMSLQGGYTFEQMMSFEYLIDNLYVIGSGTSITSNELVPQTLLAKNLSVTKGEGYQILIYHTHSQEAYADSVPGDVSQTVVGMGDLLSECLEQYGYSVLHHRGIYDMTDGVLDRDPAYTKALPVLSSILEAHPEIQVIIDLHRDGVQEDVRLVQETDGKPTAKIMYFNGLCRDENGETETLSNPNREENLAFSLQMALTTMAEYPGLTRCIYLRGSRYNLHLRGKSALIEVGAQTSTVEEVRNAIPILADILNQVLND